MRIFQINFYDMFSTGKIMLGIAQAARERGFVVKTSSKAAKISFDLKRNDPNHLYIGTRVANTIHRYFSWITDLQDCGTIFGSLNLIWNIERFKPDVVHLHDIVGWYVNIDILFRYLKWRDIPVVWTFHDCWAFTGRCIYFDHIGCDNWRSGCGDCPQLGYMPRTWYFDRSAWNFRRKKRLFTALKRLQIVTPSQWLADLTKESFFADYPIKVINNGIDLTRFKPTEGETYRKLKAMNKRIVLGVAATWSHRKGIDVLFRLARDLGDDYIVLLVGAAPHDIPSDVTNAVAYPRTHNVEELAEIYTAADLFANPTLEDNFPTVNLEALACGTPIVTYRTGGSPESVDENTGRVVAQGDYDAFKEAVLEVAQLGKTHFFDHCLERSKLYDINTMLDEYVSMYKSELR